MHEAKRTLGIADKTANGGNTGKLGHSDANGSAAVSPTNNGSDAVSRTNKEELTRAAEQFMRHEEAVMSEFVGTVRADDAAALQRFLEQHGGSVAQRLAKR